MHGISHYEQASNYNKLQLLVANNVMYRCPRPEFNRTHLIGSIILYYKRRFGILIENLHIGTRRIIRTERATCHNTIDRIVRTVVYTLRTWDIILSIYGTYRSL